MTARIALIGAGSMGRNHARIIAESAEAALAVIVDPAEHAGRGLAEQFGVDWSPELRETDRLDGVVVAASTEHHFTIASQVLALRLPMLIEKPVCPSLDQTLEILEASERASVPIMCGFLERFNPAVITARRMISEPLYARAERHSPYAPRIKTGVAWDLLVHDVDLISQLFGGVEPDRISAEAHVFHPASAPGAEDVADVTLSFPSGMASASASRLGQRKVRTLVVQTLRDMLEIDLLRRGVTLYRHTTVSETESGGSGFRQVTEMEIPEVVGREPLAAQFDRFLDLVHGRADPEEERRSIIPAHRIVDEALRSRHPAPEVRASRG